MKVLFIGDVFGTQGQKAVKKYLPKLKMDYKPSFIFLNGENIDKGFGITKAIYKELMSMGISAITLGNHAFGKKDLLEYIDGSKIIRPANYPDVVPGQGYINIKFNDKTITLVNMMGRVFMGDSLNNPFDKIDQIIDEVNELGTDYIFVDFHAEATSEKLAFGHYCDGRVTAVVGTHTHVPTADAMVLPKGTMYISDIGMTGAKYGILGADKDLILRKFTTGLRERIVEEQSNILQFNAVILDTVTNQIKSINIFE